MTFLTAFEFEQSSWVLTEVKITTFQKFAVDIFVVATPAVAKLHDPGKNRVRGLYCSSSCQMEVYNDIPNCI